MAIQGLPTPPTDNLYKFLALAGVSLVVVGLWGYVSSVENIVAPVDALALEQAELARIDHRERGITAWCPADN